MIVRVMAEKGNPGVIDLEQHLAFELTRVVEEGAVAAARTMGQGDRKGSDQAAVLMDGAEELAILGKPGTAARCIEQLRNCSGHRVVFLTAVAVVRHRDASVHQFVDTTRVQFRALDEATIERYVARESPLDCAGGFKSEGLGISLCESIDSADPSALIGLPLIELCAVLRRVGFELP